MSTTLNDEHWLNLITQCRSSGLTDRQWCIKNGIPVSTANVKHFFTLLGKMFFTPYGKEFFTYLGKQIFTS